jgi:TetR/AcrR family transcriptional regulator, transcriptional repressor of bet genes
MRRRRIAEVAVDVIARDGLEAATIRRIAAEIGCSTAFITHYFSNKEQLLLWAYRALAHQAQEEVGAVIARDPGDTVGALIAMTATNASSMRCWRLYIAFWDRASRDEAFARERQLHLSKALGHLTQIVQARYGDRPDVEGVCHQLTALVQGLSIQTLTHQRHRSNEELRRVYSHQLRLLLGDKRAGTRTVGLVS